jgi:hypothetical protein
MTDFEIEYNDNQDYLDLSPALQEILFNFYSVPKEFG